MSQFDIDVGERIKSLRVEGHHTQQDLADKIGIGRLAIGSIEGGTRKLYVDEAVDLAKAFCITLEELLRPAKLAEMDVFEFILWRLDYNATDMGEIGKYVRWDYIVNYVNEAHEKYSDTCERR